LFHLSLKRWRMFINKICKNQTGEKVLGAKNIYVEHIGWR
jgi:hypothetical protein